MSEANVRGVELGGLPILRHDAYGTIHPKKPNKKIAGGAGRIPSTFVVRTLSPGPSMPADPPVRVRVPIQSPVDA